MPTDQRGNELTIGDVVLMVRPHFHNTGSPRCTLYRPDPNCNTEEKEVKVIIKDFTPFKFVTVVGCDGLPRDVPPMWLKKIT